MEQQFTLNKIYDSKLEIKKSVFISHIYPIQNKDEANKILKQVRKEYSDASHNCYAYVLNQDNVEIKKSSDDGEPSSTAGIVILNQLEKNNITNALIIVTRYFGGQKLGAGGLIRAYSRSANDVINLIEEKIKVQKMVILKLEINYSLYELLTKLLKEYELISKEFLNIVTLQYLIPESDKNKLISLIKDSTNDKASFWFSEENHVAKKG